MAILNLFLQVFGHFCVLNVSPIKLVLQFLYTHVYVHGYVQYVFMYVYVYYIYTYICS